MKKYIKKTLKKQRHTSCKYKHKSKTYSYRHTRKGGKTSNYKPIPLPDLPSVIDNSIQDMIDESSSLSVYGGKRIRKSRKKYKGGFKTDTVDELENRDDDWLITKQ